MALWKEDERKNTRLKGRRKRNKNGWNFGKSIGVRGRWIKRSKSGWNNGQIIGL